MRKYDGGDEHEEISSIFLWWASRKSEHDLIDTYTRKFLNWVRMQKLVDIIDKNEILEWQIFSARALRISSSCRRNTVCNFVWRKQDIYFVS